MAKKIFTGFVPNRLRKFYMQVYPINNHNKYNTNFKQGLTPEIVDYVKHMDALEYMDITYRLWKKYGMISFVNASNTVAFCLEKTADIMSKAGFKLPKVFSVERLDYSYYGEYNSYNCVCINSVKKEFFDLEQQDKMEEDIRKGKPFKPHFLDTYIHEFSHAAHCKNIMAIHGGKEGKQIFFGDMSMLAPYDVILKPFKALIQKLFPQTCEDIIYEILSKYDYLFSTANLPEYFAEKNTMLISEKLGNNLNIDNITNDISAKFNTLPADFDMKKQKDAIKRLRSKYKVTKLIEDISLDKHTKQGDKLKKNLVNIFEKELNYLESEIWNGNVEKLEIHCKQS